MKKSLAIIQIVAVICILVQQTQAIFVVPEININLDLSPEQRWVPALQLVIQKYGFNYTFQPLFQSFQWVIDQLPSGAVEQIGNTVNAHYNEYYRELSGLASYFSTIGHSEVDVNFLATWVYMHELPHANFSSSQAKAHQSKFLDFKECTGVLAADSNGVVFHGRNMDKGVESPRNMTLRMTITKNSVVVANVTDYYWFSVGFVTGFKNGSFSISENWRNIYQDYDGQKMLEDIYAGAIPQVWMFREALINHDWNYDQTLQYFIDKYTPAPMFLIIAGAEAWQGAIVSRDPNTELPIYYLKQNGTDGWILVVTNYDLWIPDPPDDPRRTVATQTLQQMTQKRGASIFGVLGTISTYPVQNEGTIYSAIMCSANYFEESYGQFGITAS